MNNIFSANRFAQLFWKHSIEHLRNYAMSVAVLAGILLLLVATMLLISHSGLNAELQTTTFVFVLLVAGAIFTSTIFADAGDKRTAVLLLMLPASHFEKFLVRWVYSYVVFQVVFVAVYYVVIWLTSLFIHQHNGQIVNIFVMPTFPVIFLSYAALHSAIIWGSVFFRKLHFIKTAFILFIAFMLVAIFNHQLLSALFKTQVMSTLPFANAILVEKEHFFVLENDSGNQLYALLALSCAAIIFWGAAYMRLVEKEV